MFPLFFWLSFHFLSSSFSNHQPAVKIFFSLWCLFLHFSGHHLHFFLNPSHSHSFFLLWLSFSFLSPFLSNHQPIVKIFLSLMVHFFPLPYVCFSFFFFTGAAVLFKACSFYYPEHNPTPRLCTCWSHFFPLAKTSYGSLFFLS